MADVNMENKNSIKKRKLSSQESIIELSDDENVLNVSCGSADVEFVESEVKTPLHESAPSQSYDSGFFTQSSSEGLSQDINKDVEIISEEDNISSQDIKESSQSSIGDVITESLSGVSDGITADCIDKSVRKVEQDLSSDVVVDVSNVIQDESNCVVEESFSQDTNDGILKDLRNESSANDVNDDVTKELKDVTLENLNNVNVQDLKQSLLKLEDKVQQLMVENESLKLKACTCQNQEALIAVKFNCLENFNAYKHLICSLFKGSSIFDVHEQETNLLINFYKKAVKPEERNVNEDLLSTPCDKHTKRKKRKSSVTECSDSNEDIFVLDTTPSLSTRNNLKYDSKFDFLSATNKDEDTSKGNASMCFNCDEGHNLRDCPKPKNYGKINAARQKFKPQNKGNVYKRYHLECDQRFGHLQPGKISEKLQQALGLRSNQLPEHIYRMRKLGYPPGWLNEILATEGSDLVLFDYNGKNAREQKKIVEDIDVSKIIDYHGFNVPLLKGYKDEYRIYGSAPYSKLLSKSSMVDFLKSYKKTTDDNLNSCDMEIDNIPSDKEVDNINTSVDDKDELNTKCKSPTLVELEIEKNELLKQLTEDVNRESQLDLSIASNMESEFITIDQTGSLDDSIISVCDKTLSMEYDENRSCESPILKTIKTSYIGTPILKSASPYSHLPHSDNFTKDVSDVINFENLPNSTGKYDQMVGVIEKVRKVLKTRRL